MFSFRPLRLPTMHAVFQAQLPEPSFCPANCLDEERVIAYVHPHGSSPNIGNNPQRADRDNDGACDLCCVFIYHQAD